MPSHQPVSLGVDAPILVPVSHEETAGPALAYAAAEAQRQGCPVLVVHVERTHAAIPKPRLRPPGGEAVAGLLLACRRRLAGLLRDDVPVRTEVRHGGVVGTLVALSRSARLAVVPAARPDHHGRVPGLSVTNALAARAECPVVVVPAGWAPRDPDPPDSTGDTSVVVMGLRDLQVHEDGEVLRAAFAAAAATGAVLHVVHAWEPSPKDPLAVPRRSGVSITGIHRDVSAAVAAIAADHPDVPYAVIVLQGDPTQVLAERARGADLLVIGRLRARTTAGALLGRTARDLLGEMPCPVLVVHVAWTPERRAPVEADQSAGATVLQVLAP